VNPPCRPKGQGWKPSTYGRRARALSRSACITGVPPTYDEKHIDSCPLSYLFLTLLPASAKRLVKLDQALALVASGLGERELGVEQRSLPIEDFEVGGDAAPIPYEGCVDGILQIPDRVSCATRT